MAKSVDPDQTAPEDQIAPRGNLILVGIVCSDLTVPMLSTLKVHMYITSDTLVWYM